MASYFLYKNIRTGGFSITHHGIVIERSHNFTLFDVHFNVSEKGRQRVLKEQVKNVHAQLQCLDYTDGFTASVILQKDMREVTYNPYRDKTFIYRDTQETCTYAKKALCFNGKVYVPAT